MVPFMPNFVCQLICTLRQMVDEIDPLAVKLATFWLQNVFSEFDEIHDANIPRN